MTVLSRWLSVKKSSPTSQEEKKRIRKASVSSLQDDSDSYGTQSSIIVFIGRARNVPSLDLIGESDPRIVVRLHDAAGHALPQEGASADWCTKTDARNPVWNSARRLRVPAGDNVHQYVLDIELWDYDRSSSDDLIGRARVAVGDLSADKLSTIVLKCKKKSKSSNDPCTLTLRLAKQPPTRKNIYFVRHGESKWNKAQDDKDVRAMLSTTDHPLNDTGVRQAQDLQQRVSNALQAGCHKQNQDAEWGFLHAQAIHFSPLTRAMQTGLIALKPVIQQLKRIIVNPNAREKRNFGGKDSSGHSSGKEILTRVCKELCEFFPLDEASEITFGSKTQQDTISWDLSLVQDPWWNDSAESSKLVAARVRELFAQLEFCPESDIIVVGHSHFFREVFRCAMQNPVPELQEQKLMNGGVAWAHFDFGESSSRPIIATQLLFGTKLVD